MSTPALLGLSRRQAAAFGVIPAAGDSERICISISQSANMIFHDAIFIKEVIHTLKVLIPPIDLLIGIQVLEISLIGQVLTFMAT